MRLINTSTLRLERVADFDLQDPNKYPNGYSILSHRWGEEGSEIDFEDVSGLRNDAQPNDAHLQRVMAKAGWPKFEGACNLARTKGFDLIWIDTCCIDKRDSVELSEAVNSMYRWYAEARICFAYLQDVGGESDRQFKQSKWFDRGWTLQELIAPNEVWFYDFSWSRIGDKVSKSQEIQTKTGIDELVLSHRVSPNSCSVAQRMSWAARRKTTRIEDAAYSLMGLSDVNMPMLYGEREKAFTRLQEQIIVKNGDLTIFAWEMEKPTSAPGEVSERRCGLLAPSPACFANSGKFPTQVSPETFIIGQQGLSIKLPYNSYGLDRYLVTILSFDDLREPESVYILLARTQSDKQFVRVSFPEGHSLTYCHVLRSRTMKEFHVRQGPQEILLTIFPGFWLRHLEASDKYNCITQILSRAATTNNSWVSLANNRMGIAGIVKCEPSKLSRRTERYFKWMIFGFDQSCNPLCFLLHQPRSVMKDLDLSINDTLFAKVMRSPPGMYEEERSALFDDTMLHIPWPEGEGVPSVEKPMSYHLFRGSHGDGLDVTLNSVMKLRISIKRCPIGDAFKAQEIWTVDITCYESSSGRDTSKSWFRRSIFG